MAMMNKSAVKIGDVVKIITYLAGLTGVVSVYRHINPAYSLSFTVLFVLSVYFEHRQNFFIPRWFLNLAALAVVVFSFYRVNIDNLVIPAVEGLLMLLAVKFLEEKRFRDFMQIYAICVLLLSGSSLLSIDIEFAVYFLILVFLLGISIVLLTYYSQDPGLELEKKTVLKIVLKSLPIPLLAIPATLLLFIILPRTNYPLFDFINKGEKAKSGFADNVRLGEVSGIQDDASVIFRAKMPRVDEGLLYWRGIVLGYFDGRSWTVAQRSRPLKMINMSGKRISQTIYLRPYENKYLFALDKPSGIDLRYVRTYDDLTFSLLGNVERMMRYEAVSVLSEVIPEPEEDIDKDRYLQLPENISAEIISLVDGLVRGKKGKEEEVIKALLYFLREGEYKYSLENLPRSGKPLEDFLFKYKYGNCEYFASALAVMLRLADVPARLVGGYLGGYYNNIEGYYLIPQRNAHVWVEAYARGAGWIRLDPTPASATGFGPERDFIFKVRLYFDIINYYWNAVVINYDFEKQIAVLQKIKSELHRPKLNLTVKKEKLLEYAGILAAVAGSVFILYVLIFRRKTSEERLRALFLKAVEKHGYEKKKAQGLEEFAAGIKEAGLRQAAYRFAEEFQRHFYRDEKFTAGDIKSLKEIIRNLKTIKR